MRYIAKGIEPNSLSVRRRELRSTPGIGDNWYNELGSKVKDAIKSQCLREQGYLCGYTGLRIEMETSHLEHMWPQSQCSKEEQIDYANLLACFNGPNAGHPGFGAKQKDNWPTGDQRDCFIRPTEPRCEVSFEYGRDGTIRSASGENFHAASETIREIRLDHENLVNWRKAALEPLLKIDRLEQLRKRVDLLKECYDGKLEEHSFIKLQHLEKKLEKLERKRRFARDERR